MYILSLFIALLPFMLHAQAVEVPSEKLQELLQIVGMPAEKKDIQDISTWAQANLLRKGERWEEQTTKFEAQKEKLLPLFAELGLTTAKEPSQKKYEGALLAGAMLPRVRLRLLYLVDQWNKGVRFTYLYFLGGERMLDPIKENQEALQAPAGHLPKTECEMMQLVWEQSAIPDEMRQQVKVVFVNAPSKLLPNGLRARPDRLDTFVAWLQMNPPPGRYLSVANAPYIARQDLIAQMIVPEHFSIETVGEAAHPNEKMAILLDELARLLYASAQQKVKRT